MNKQISAVFEIGTEKNHVELITKVYLLFDEQTNNQLFLKLEQRKTI